MEYEEFRIKVSQLHEIKSRTGKNYKSVRVIGDVVMLLRADSDNPQENVKIDLHNLFNFYLGNEITTKGAKKYGLSGKQSPSVAIIDALGDVPAITSVVANKAKGNVQKSGNNNSSIMVESFPPIEDESSEILILGTAPGKESLLKNEYYASNSNSMWKIIASLFNNGAPFQSYMEKLDCLHRNHIALWDVYSSCDRESSRDSKIENGQMNNLKAFIESHPIKLVLLNGKEAMEAFEATDISIPHKYVGSTSNAYPRPPEEKIEEWRKAFGLE